MSSEVGRIQGRNHPFTVSRSDGGVELAIWKASKGFGDALTPDAARGLAALLNAAADICDKRIAERLKST